MRRASDRPADGDSAGGAPPCVQGDARGLADLAHATAIMVDALALMGEMLKAAEKNAGVRMAGKDEFGSSRLEPPKANTPTLADVGITKKESSVAQALATVRDSDPEAYEAFRAGEAPVSKAPAVAHGKANVDEVKYAATRPQVKPASKPAPSKPAAPTEPAWQEFFANLTAVSEFCETINPNDLPKGTESWQLAKTLESAARSLMATSSRITRQTR